MMLFRGFIIFFFSAKPAQETARIRPRRRSFRREKIKMKFKIYLMLQSITKHSETKTKETVRERGRLWANNDDEIPGKMYRLERREIRRRNVAFYGREAPDRTRKTMAMVVERELQQRLEATGDLKMGSQSQKKSQS